MAADTASPSYCDYIGWLLSTWFVVCHRYAAAGRHRTSNCNAPCVVCFQVAVDKGDGPEQSQLGDLAPGASVEVSRGSQEHSRPVAVLARGTCDNC